MSTRTTGVLSAEEWLTLQVDADRQNVVIGSPAQPIVRPLTKNLIEGPEKSFKTSFMLRQMLGHSCGTTVYPLLPLPVIQPHKEPVSRKVLYVHGELSPPEIKERTQSAVVGLSRPLDNFFQVRDLDVHLIQKQGQRHLRQVIGEVRPVDLVLDPWQSFIIGHDENEYKEVSQATHFIDHLIDDFGLTVYLATHTGKDRSRGTRGHSVLAGWRDTLIKLERKGNGGRVTVTVEPRWAAPVEPFTLEFDQGTLVPTGSGATFTRQAEAIRAVVHANGGGVTREAVGQALGLSDEALRQALKRAVDRGAVKVADDGQVTCEPGPGGIPSIVNVAATA